MFLIFIFFLFYATIIDLKWQIIPNKLIAIGMVISGVTLVLNQVAYKGNGIFFATNSVKDALMGSLSTGFLMFAIAILTFLVAGEAGMLGMGDVKVFLPIGLYLGMDRALYSLFASFIIAGIISSILVIFKLKRMDSHVPFAPFITLGVISSLIWA